MRIDQPNSGASNLLSPGLSNPVGVTGGGVAPPVNTDVPTIDNTSPVVGDTLTGTNGTWTGSPSSYTYQWNADGTPIGAETAITFVVTTAQIGQSITITVTAHNAGGNTPADSGATSQVVDKAPVNTDPPTLSDTSPVEGDSISVSNGVWQNSPTSYTYQWQLDSVDVGGETASSISILRSYMGKTLRCNVTAHNSNPSSTTAPTPQSDAIAAPPINVSAPVCTCDGINAPNGPAIGGVDTLTTDNGTWTGYPSPTFTYTNNCNNGGTANTVLTSVVDSGGKYFTVMATNTQGNPTADSNQITVI